MREIISYLTFYTQAQLLKILKFNFRILIVQTFRLTAVLTAENCRARNERGERGLVCYLPLSALDIAAKLLKGFCVRLRETAELGRFLVADCGLFRGGTEVLHRLA